MDAKISMTMTTQTQEGKKSTKAVTDISENASNQQLVTLAQALNNITTNTLGDVGKVTKEIVSGVTYYDLSITYSVENDTNNAVSIVGNAITVDTTKLPVTYNITEMVTVFIKTQLDNQDFIPTNFSSTGSGEYIDEMAFSVSITNNTLAKGLGVMLFQPSNQSTPPESTTGTATVTIPADTYNGKHYNGVTVTFNLV